MVRVVLSCIATLLVLLMANHGAEAFAPRSMAKTTSAVVAVDSSSSVVLSMGLFDFFSEDARKEREAKKQAEIEEQERLQKEILKRRANPEKMEEYQARVAIRRRAIARGEDGDKYKVMMEDDED